MDSEWINEMKRRNPNPMPSEVENLIDDMTLISSLESFGIPGCPECGGQGLCADCTVATGPLIAKIAERIAQ